MNESPYLLDDSLTDALISLLYDSLGNYHNSILTGELETITQDKRGLNLLRVNAWIFFYVGTFSKGRFIIFISK